MRFLAIHLTLAMSKPKTLRKRLLTLGCTLRVIGSSPLRRKCSFPICGSLYLFDPLIDIVLVIACWYDKKTLFSVSGVWASKASRTAAILFGEAWCWRDWIELKNPRSKIFRSGLFAGWACNSICHPSLRPSRTISESLGHAWGSGIVLLKTDWECFWSFWPLLFYRREQLFKHHLLYFNFIHRFDALSFDCALGTILTLSLCCYLFCKRPYTDFTIKDTFIFIIKSWTSHSSQKHYLELEMTYAVSWTCLNWIYFDFTLVMKRLLLHVLCGISSSRQR